MHPFLCVLFRLIYTYSMPAKKTDDYQKLKLICVIAAFILTWFVN